MQIEFREGIRLVHLSGPLDASTRERFREMMEKFTGEPEFRLILDCTNVIIINSQVLGLLGHFNRVADRKKSFLGVAALDRPLVKIIDRLGMGKLVPLYPTVEDALAAAKNMSPGHPG